MRNLASRSSTICMILASLATLPSCGDSPNPASKEPQKAGPQQDGWTTSPTGLQHKVLRKGSGTTRPTAIDTVTVKYRGWLENGSEFDKNDSTSFAVTGVIRGWTEGLQLMTKGSVFQFKIPPELAYGNTPRPKIPANSLLNFEVELLSIKVRKAPRGLPVYPIPADGEMKTDASGIEYCIYRAGTGDLHPQLEDKIYAKFTWWTASGVTIRSTRTLKEAPPMPVGQPTEGWTKALQMMTEGAHYKFKIPAKLGYLPGKPRPAQVPENSDLIMEIELMEILKGPRFYKPKPAELKKTASGTEYAIIRGGNPSKVPGAKDYFTARYACWTPEGKFLESSFTHGMTLAGKKGDFSIPFLNEIPPLMGEGATWVVVCEPEVQFPRTPRPRKEYNKTSLWQIELIKVTPRPVFVKPDPAKYKRSASGLQFQAVKTVSGKGQSVAPSQSAIMIMTAWTPSGTIVDTSVATPTGHRLWRLNSIPSGFREALQMMKVGETYRFIVPASLRKGERKNKLVPQGSDLILSIELVGVR